MVYSKERTGGVGGGQEQKKECWEHAGLKSELSEGRLRAGKQANDSGARTPGREIRIREHL